LTEIEILVAMHVNQISETESSFGPPPALAEFVKENTQSCAVITHPFSWSHSSASKVELVFKGKTVQKIILPRLPLPEPVAYLKDLLVNVWAVLFLRLKVRLYVGADGINTLAGLVILGLGRGNTVVYYSIDYTPTRFRNTFLNGAYHALDTFCARRADFVWNLSSRMARVRKMQGLEEARNLVVPVGTSPRRIIPAVKKDRTAIVFLSHLIHSKGVDIALDAISIVSSRVPNVKLESRKSSVRSILSHTLFSTAR
jgi:glycosyltransferase involved in cell wall biosynthesis